MGGGGKGGSSSQQAEIPQYIEDAQKNSIGRAEDLAQVGYMPWMGPDVAAMNMNQKLAHQNTGNAASAFGLAPTGMNMLTGIPEAQDFGGGIMGHSSYPIYEQAKQQWMQANPEQARAYEGLFVGGGEPQAAPQPAVSGAQGLAQMAAGQPPQGQQGGGMGPQGPQNLMEIIAMMQGGR